MIRGYIDEEDHAVVDVTVSGLRASLVLPAYLDTEFNSDLSLPTSIAVTLGLDLTGEAEVILADGRVVRELTFRGVADLGEEPREVEIFLSDSPEALVGRTWLHGRVLHANYAQGEFVIEDEAEP
jgi:predicted aspartyl protease